MSASSPELINADWPAPESIVAFTSTRQGGFSQREYEGLNLGLHVGDDAEAVAKNRKLLLDSCQGLDEIQWLEQVHGDRVVAASGALEQADASYTQSNALACAVMTADCLPLLVCDREGRQVAAIHAGWRGLLAGVIEETIIQFE